MKRNKPQLPAIYGGLTLPEAKELKELSAILSANEFKVFTEAEEDTKECKRYFVLLNKRMGYLRTLHSQNTTTFLPQPNNFKPAYQIS